MINIVATQKGNTPLKTLERGTSLATALMMKQLIPIGGVIIPCCITITIITPNQRGSNPILETTGKKIGVNKDQRK